MSDGLLTESAVRNWWEALPGAVEQSGAGDGGFVGGPAVSSGGVSLPDEVRLGLTGWRPDPGGGDKFTDAIRRVEDEWECAIPLGRKARGHLVSELTRELLGEWSWKMSLLDDPVTGKPYTLSKILEVSGVQIDESSLFRPMHDWKVRMSAVLLPSKVRGAIIKFRPGVEGRRTLPEFVASLRGRDVSLVSSVSPGFVLHPSTEAMRELAVGMLSEVEGGRPRYTLDQVVGVFGG
ncbi:glycosyltransferase, partial [Lentzea flava]|uniref:glycosyltransferase n=1 Tax=Lentzea flava TaxID=103732 RepID=UPI001E606333